MPAAQVIELHRRVKLFQDELHKCEAQLRSEAESKSQLEQRLSSIKNDRGDPDQVGLELCMCRVTLNMGLIKRIIPSQEVLENQLQAAKSEVKTIGFTLYYLNGISDCPDKDLTLI